MNSRPGTLRGGHIRKLPPRLLERFGGKAEIKGRYRVTGYRDGQGEWVSRVKLDDAGSRYGYRRRIGGKLLTVRPTDTDLRRSPYVAVEVEITRRGQSTIYYTTLEGPIG